MRCPDCKNRNIWKWNRMSWMRWTPGNMQCRRCSKCGKEFIVWLWSIPMGEDFAHGMTILWHWFLAIVVLFLVVIIATGF